jgi:hypothetical protein
MKLEACDFFSYCEKNEKVEGDAFLLGVILG